MSAGALHEWAAVAQVVTPIALILTVLGAVFRGGRWLSKPFQGLISATRANTAALADLTTKVSGMGTDISAVDGRVSELDKLAAVHDAKIKHNTERIHHLEKEIWS